MAVAALQSSNELIQAIFRGSQEEFVRLLDPESANYQVSVCGDHVLYRFENQHGAITASGELQGKDKQN